MHHHISTTDPEMEHYHCSLKSFDKIREENAAQNRSSLPSYYLLFRNTSSDLLVYFMVVKPFFETKSDFTTAPRITTHVK